MQLLNLIICQFVFIMPKATNECCVFCHNSEISKTKEAATQVFFVEPKAAAGLVL